MSSGIVGLLILLLCIVLFITEWLPSVVTGALGCLLSICSRNADDLLSLA